MQHKHGSVFGAVSPRATMTCHWMLQVNDTGGCSVIDFGLSYVSAMAEDKVRSNLAIWVER